MTTTNLESPAKVPGSMDDITRLPPELLNIVFRFVKFSGPRQNVISCLLVCRHWYEVATPLAWISVSLRNENIERFVNIAECLPWQRGFVRSLSLQLNGARPNEQKRKCNYPYKKLGFANRTHKEAARIWNTIERLARIIEVGMKGLVSFSLRMDKPVMGTWFAIYSEEVWMRSSTVAKVLDALPISCVDLELDMNGRDNDTFQPGCGSNHLCTTLQTSLPRLRHLRLRMRTLCPRLLLTGVSPNFMLAAAPNLRSLLISMILDPGRLDTGECLEPKRDLAPTDVDHSKSTSEAIACFLPETVSYAPNGERASHALLEKSLRKACEANVFPRANAIQILRSVSSARLSYEQQDRFDPKRRVLNVKRTYDGRNMVARNKHNEEIFGSKDELETEIEGSVWSTTVEGDRCTPDLRKSPPFLQPPCVGLGV